jgi:N-acetylneuraminic acid mutarotase
MMMEDSNAATDRLGAHVDDEGGAPPLAAAAPTLTLSLSGVEFSLQPVTAESAVDFRQGKDSQEMLWNLSNFTGTLRVRVSSSSTSTTSCNQKTTAATVDSTTTKPFDFVNNNTNHIQPKTITPKTTHVASSPLLKRNRSYMAPEEESNNEAAEHDDGSIVLQTESPVPKKPFQQQLAEQAVEDEQEEMDAANAVITSQNACFSPSQATTLLGQPSQTQTLLGQPSQTQTLLGQPDFSQTQTTDLDEKDENPSTNNGDTSRFSQTQTTNLDENPTNNNHSDDIENKQQVVENHDDNQELEAPVPSMVQQIMMESPSPQDNKDEDDDDDDDSSTQSRVMNMTEDTDIGDVLSVTKPPPARVSLGGSPLLAPKQRASPPCPRWGHAMTEIGNDRILVYGGQTTSTVENSDDDEDTTELKSEATDGLPRTLQDVYIYDLNLEQWTKPFNCDGMPRQWHTATFLPDRQLLISFGGEAITTTPATKNKSPVQKCKTTDQVMVLDTEIMLWYPPTVSGDVPSGRSGHTATMLNHELIVFGGVKGSKWLNTVSCLDTLRWKWRTPKIQGMAPKPRSYHTATALPDNRVVIFGGNDATQSFATVHVLETSPHSSTEEGGTEASSNSKWQWTHPKVMGRAPAGRTGHSATLLADNKTICIYGGWDPNTEEDPTESMINIDGDDDEHMMFQDSYLLDIEKWVWRQGPPVIAAASYDEHENDTDCGPKRVGHTAVLSKGGTEVLVFGGRVPRDRFAGDFQKLIVSSSNR